MNDRARQIWENQLIRLKKREWQIAFLEFYMDRLKQQKRVEKSRDKINKFLGKIAIEQ